MHSPEPWGGARLAGLAALIAWAALSLAASSAHGAPGEIAFDSCVVATNVPGQKPTGTVCDDVSGTGPGQFESLSQPSAIATAANGHAYTADVFEASISNLAPNPTTRKLELLDCVEGEAGANPGNCTDLGTTATVLAGPEGLAAVDDDLYVADFSTDAVLHLKIGDGGSLSLAGCLASNPALAPDCTDISATTNALEARGRSRFPRTATTSTWAASTRRR